MIPVQEIDVVDYAFPAQVRHLMPPYDASRRETWGNRLFSDWFFFGLASLQLVPKDGVDAAKALRHISAIMRSYEPKHEHKEQACAVLFEEWFEAPPVSTWERRPHER